MNTTVPSLRRVDSTLKQGSTAAIWWLTGALLVGTFIRFATLNHQSFWLDESATLTILHKPFASLLTTIRETESTPPLYYYAAWAWSRLFGFQEVAVRSLSAVFGTATIIAVALVARQAGGRRASVFATWVAATMPLLVWYSQEARSYSLLTLLCTGSVGATLHLRRAPSLRAAIIWILLAVAALATHYFAGFVVVGEICLLLAQPGPRLRRRDLALPIAAIMAAAVPLVVLAQDQYANTSFVRSQSLRSSLPRIAGQLLVGYGVDGIMVAAALVSVLGFAACIWPLSRSGNRLASDCTAVLVILVLAAIFPIALAVAGPRLVDTKNLLYVLPLLAVLAGAGAGASGRVWAVAAVVGAGLTVVCHIFFDPTLQRTDSRGVARALGQPTTARAILLTPPDSRTLLIWPYFPTLGSAGSRPVKIRAVVLVGMTRKGGLNRDVAPLSALRFRPPPGFREISATSTSTYTMRRFQAERPEFVTAAELIRRAAPTPVEVLLQP